MKTTTAAPAAMKRPNNHGYINEGLSAKKTAFIIVTVVGCIAILWPKVFHPMMFGGTSPKAADPSRDFKGSSGCCDVVLDREKFLNATPFEIGPQLYRKRLNLLSGELSLRQERPSHLHPESIYQAMRERGRAIPAIPSVPIVEKYKSSSNPPPRIVEGRPGPIPGMRPPMGAGSVHQPQAKGNSMGFLMPIYTVGIIVFFVYTIMKITFKKTLPNAPYGAAPSDTNFRKDVFGQSDKRKSIDETKGTKLVVTAIQGLIDAADEQLKLQEKNTTSDLNKESNEKTTSTNGSISNGHTQLTSDNEEKIETVNHKQVVVEKSPREEKNEKDYREHQELNSRKGKEGSVERSVAILGMEVTASCEGGQKWTGRPPTPVFFKHNEHSADDLEELPLPQSIYLEGSLAHESQILVSDSETKTEEIYDEELNGSPEEPAVVLSSKMTLSLINLNAALNNDNKNKSDIESPLADDIEIIGHDEN